MKKLLLILPLSFVMAASAQDTKDTKKDVKRDAKENRDVKATTATSLDGKSFKITLSGRPDNREGMRSGTPDKMNTSGTGTSRDMNTNTGTNVSGTGTSAPTGINTSPSGTTTNTQGTNTQGTGTTSGSQSTTGNVQGTPGSVGTGNTTQSGTTTRQNPSGVGAMDNSTPSSNTGATPPPANATDNTDNTAIAPTTPGNRTTTDQATTTAGTDETFDNKKMILRFENGVIHSSGLSSKGMDCPYNINSTEGNMVTFSSNCKSTVTKSKGMWSGIVDGNSIRGNFTWTDENGQNMTYTFTGSKATQKDIDASQELGSR